MRAKKIFFTAREVIIMVIFTVYLFSYITFSTMTNKNSTEYLLADQHLMMYYVDQLFFLVGLIIFFVTWEKLKNDGFMNILLRASAILFFALAAIMMLYPSSFAFLYLAPLANIQIGFIAGAFNYYISMALFGVKNLGKLVACGATMSYLLQYITQILSDNRFLILLFIFAGAGIIAILVKRSWEWVLADCIPTYENSKRGTLERKRNNDSLRTIVIMSVLAILLLTYYDSMLIRLMVNSNLEFTAYSWPRLFAIVGYLIIGVVGDYKDGRFVNITLFALILWVVLSPVIFMDNPMSNLNMCIFYVVVGATMSYLYVMFWSIAPLSSHPALVAGTGRVIDCAAGVVFSFLPWAKMSTMQILILSVVVITILFINLVYSGDFVIGKKGDLIEYEQISIKQHDLDDAAGEDNKAESNIAKQEPKEIELINLSRAFSESGGDSSDGAQDIALRQRDDESDVNVVKSKGEDDTLVRIVKKYGLTARETEVLEQLLFTEKSGQEIADTLYISRRVLQRHVSAIYEKTGVKSRVGLFRVYHDEKDN